MKWIDLPPVWLSGCLVVAWFIRWPDGWEGWFWLGIFCLGAAAVLTLGALVEFLRVRTTIIPREAPSALITGGIFRMTRNPIYVADVFILAGLSLVWGSVAGLVLVAPLGALLWHRFIRGEEARLEAAFGDDYRDYAARTRRWL